MLRSFSFRQSSTSSSLERQARKELPRKIVLDPEPQDVLLWLKEVELDHVLLVVPGDASSGKPAYVKDEKPSRIAMMGTQPTRSMRTLRKLFERMLPAQDSVPTDVWRAAEPLKTLLASQEVRQQGVRHTPALVEALRSLSEARQAQLDRQVVRLAPAPTEKEEEAVPGVELDEQALLTPADALEAWLSVADGRGEPSLNSPSRPKKVRRGQSLNLSRTRSDQLNSPARPKD